MLTIFSSVQQEKEILIESQVNPMIQNDLW